MQRTLRHFLLLSLLAAAGCGDDSTPTDTGTDANDVENDAEADVGVDTELDTGEDAEPDVAPDVAPDATPDTADADAPACEDGETTCSDDGFAILTCEAGAWTETSCLDPDGLVCEDSACVAPWTWNDPVWDACSDSPQDTGTSLADKAAHFDDISERILVHPDFGYMMSATLPTMEVDCPDGETAPCYALTMPLDEMTHDDVVQYHSGANDGLWSALYLTSQIYRYAVTEDPDVLDTIREMMLSQQRRIEIAGVPGMYVRIMRPPDHPQLPCPTDPNEYIVDPGKTNDRFVQISDAGCASTYDPDLEAFVESDHCGLDEYAGWCFLDNVSQDEYAGNMLVLGAIDLLIEDEEIRAMAAEQAGDVADYMIANDLNFRDWDGRLTEHGRLNAMALVDSPGFLAAQALAWIKVAINLTGREDLQTFYDDCLLKRDGEQDCLPYTLERNRAYHTDFLPQAALYAGNDGCTTNFNRTSMYMSNLWLLIQMETDADVRSVAQTVLDENVYHDESSRSLSVQGNPWYNFMWASGRSLGGV